jgi:ribosome-associated heat shock protein Hsp15
MYLDESPQQEKVDVVSAIFRDRGAGRPTKKERREMEKVRSR